MGCVTVYHLSPSRFRVSIQREGIRRSSLMAGRLVTHVFSSWPRNGDAVRIADIHDTLAAYIDVWECRCEHGDMDVNMQSEMLLYSDLPVESIKLVRTAKLER